jgi:plasmid replication initiation protein
LSVGDREIGVDWLKTQWQLSDKYQRLSDLKKWVIDVAVEEVNEHSNLWVTYSQRKSGRTVTHFQFQFGLKNPPKEKQQLTEEEINRQAKPEESRVAVIARLTGSPLSDVAKSGEAVAQALERKRNLAYIKKTLG